MPYTRYAIYFLPEECALAKFGAHWLGWDVARGRSVPQPDLPGIAGITATPRKYGFHGTLKPPFRLTNGCSVAQLQTAIAALAATTASAKCDGLHLAVLGRFLALIPKGDISPIARVAKACVTELDPFRAELSVAELDRRRAAGLSPAQDALLMQWGYPYVLDEFRFHLTLTAALPEDQITHWSELAAQHLPALRVPFTLDQIALTGEREDGAFELIHSYPLTG